MMKTAMKTAAAAVLYIAAVASAGAESDQRKGTDGLARLDFSVENTGKAALSCDVKLAHWYSDHLATIPSVATGHFTLWSDPQNGAVYMLNATGDRMPVERLWCGLDGKSWETRYEIGLERHEGQHVSSMVLRCDADASQTRCSAR